MHWSDFDEKCLNWKVIKHCRMPVEMKVELFSKILTNILVKTLKSVVKHNGMCFIKLNIYDMGELKPCHISLYDINKEFNINTYSIYKEYHPQAKKYISLLQKNPNIDFNKLIQILKKYSKSLLAVSLEIEYEGCISDFDPDIEFSKSEWHRIINGCICGNSQTYKWYDYQFDIIIETQWKNIYSREGTFCC